MLHIISGRAGSGKSEWIYSHIAERIKRRESGSILLVPPQYSHMAEKKLCVVGGNTASLYSEALTFITLANRIFIENGHTAVKFLNDTGRLLLLKLARDEVNDLLKIYGKVNISADFLSKLLATINELKLFNIVPETLADAALKTDGKFGDKLSDLAYISQAYDAMLSGDLYDPTDMYELSADLAAQSGYFSGKNIYIDSMNNFTPKEQLPLKVMIRDADNVYIALCGDGDYEQTDESDLFAKTYSVIRWLIAFCVKENITYEINIMDKPLRFKNETLIWLEKNLIDYTNAEYKIKDDSLKLFTAVNKRNECEKAAAQIIKWSLEGIRWKDMAIVCRTLSNYRNEIESVFEGCGIPIYMDITVSASEKPFFTALIASLEAAVDGYSERSMQRLLNSGFTGIPRSGCDILETYVKTWGIRGKKWADDKAWNAHPEGFLQQSSPQSEKKLRLLRKLRKKIVDPLELLRSASGKKVSEISEILYSCAEAGNYETRLIMRENKFRNEGNNRLADEYGQLWDIFCDILDQMNIICGSGHVKIDEYCEMFKLMLSDVSVGVIPTGIDRVSVGEAGRFRGTTPLKLILLGMNSGVFPKTIKSETLINDTERKILREGCNIWIDATETEKQFREDFIAYQTISSASEEIVFSYIEDPVSAPSHIISRLKKITGIEPRDIPLSYSLYLCAKDRNITSSPVLADEMIRRGMKIYTGDVITNYPKNPIDEETVSNLYRNPIRMSPSRIECYHNCRFEYFAEYGLGLKKTKRAEFSSQETGMFMHFVFEKLGKHVKEKGGWRSVTAGEINEYVDELCKEFYDTFFDETEYNTKRLEYLFGRISYQARILAQSMYEELSESKFEPFLFEKHFGENDGYIEYKYDKYTLLISGQLDRADLCDINGKKYIRIIDYKTGRKTFKYPELYNGLSIQLPIYLFSLLSDGYKPAGFFYMPAKAASVDLPKFSTDQEIGEAVLKEEKYTGLCIDSPEVIIAMDNNSDSGISKLPVKLKNKEISKDLYTISEKDFQRIEKRLKQLLGEMVYDIESGNVKPNPYCGAPKESCLFCDMRSICKVYDMREYDETRELKGLSKESFLKEIGDDSDEQQME